MGTLYGVHGRTHRLTEISVIIPLQHLENGRHHTRVPCYQAPSFYIILNLLFLVLPLSQSFIKFFRGL